MDELGGLVAKQAITEVLYRYCRSLDRFDREMALACWHPGGTADYGPDIHQGTGESFVEWVWQIHEELFGAHSHQITNILIEVDGTTAVSEAYVTVAMRMRDGQDVIDRGRYLDRWEERDGRWAITARRFVSDLSGASTAAAPIPLTGPATRDRSDPSWALFG